MAIFAYFQYMNICFRRGEEGSKKPIKCAYVMYEWFLSYLRGCANATAFQPQLLTAATHWSRYEHFVQKLVDFQQKI